MLFCYNDNYQNRDKQYNQNYTNPIRFAAMVMMTMTIDTD